MTMKVKLVKKGCLKSPTPSPLPTPGTDSFPSFAATSGHYYGSNPSGPSSSYPFPPNSSPSPFYTNSNASTSSTCSTSTNSSLNGICTTSTHTRKCVAFGVRARKAAAAAASSSSSSAASSRGGTDESEGDEVDTEEESEPEVTIYTADEWDRTPTEPARKLSYQ
ncbi:hypothetical protein D9613_006606 [Agrocybe pediades]|uniref:Uncharacterized protein n=1 Tax=Agrocybe pediades TaxID=84607 RepID=A0A8H4QHV1_9AGAR|nr:hypothetical protein D9613_006606 [Agrocybe pediades]